MKLFIISSLLIASIAHADFVSQKKSAMVSLEFEDYAYGMSIVQSYGMDVAGIDHKNKIVDLIVTEEEFQILKDYNLIPSSKTKGMKSSDDFSDNDNSFSFYGAFGTSAATKVDQKYKTPEEIETILKAIHAKYPKITKLEVIGYSLEGRPIYAMKISDNPNKREINEPTVLFNSLHHAREVMTPEVGIDIIETLVEGYMKSITKTFWIKATEIWVVPMVNPDGNNKVWTTDKWWRKNARDGHGVDLNRNYPYGWNSCNGSSGNTWSQTYRGTDPGSEPETQVIMSLVERIRPVFDISYHSYSELVIYPFGCSPNAADQIVVNVGQKLGELLDYRAGTAWELLYNADGGDIDWMYAKYQVIPFVLELNSRSEGFQPSFDKWRDVTVEKNRVGWQYLLKRLHGTGLRGIVRDQNKDIVNDFVVKVEKLIDGEYQLFKEYRGNPDGTYHIVLEKKKYRFTFIAEGFKPIVKKWKMMPWLKKYNPRFK